MGLPENVTDLIARPLLNDMPDAVRRRIAELIRHREAERRDHRRVERSLDAWVPVNAPLKEQLTLMDYAQARANNDDVIKVLRDRGGKSKTEMDQDLLDRRKPAAPEEKPAAPEEKPAAPAEKPAAE
jgi:hypothetical protein